MVERIKKAIDAQMYIKGWWYYLMWLPSKCFAMVCTIRATLYKVGFFKTYHFPVPVVVVGNITVGGNGKTPMVAHLVQLLMDKGYKPGIVSRGYGASTRIFPLWVRPSSDDAGDEAVMHANLGVPVVIDPNRVRGIGFLLSQTDVDVVISDDGLQHYAMGRDIEIVMHDSNRFGNGARMPAGPLRESHARIDTVDFIVEKGGQKGHHLRLEADKLVSLDQKAEKPLDGFKKVHLVSAIACPSGFKEHFQFIKEERLFLDHHRFRMKDFTGLEDAAIVMTEKDAVKCRNLPLRNAWYLKTQTVVNKSFDTQFLHVLKYIIKHKTQTGFFQKAFGVT